MTAFLGSNCAIYIYIQSSAVAHKKKKKWFSPNGRRKKKQTHAFTRLIGTSRFRLFSKVFCKKKKIKKTFTVKILRFYDRSAAYTAKRIAFDGPRRTIHLYIYIFRVATNIRRSMYALHSFRLTITCYIMRDHE